jgi:hypothetical protein
LPERGRVELEAVHVDCACDLLAVGDERIVRCDVDLEVWPTGRRTALGRRNGDLPTPK